MHLCMSISSLHDNLSLECNAFCPKSSGVGLHRTGSFLLLYMENRNTEVFNVPLYILQKFCHKHSAPKDFIITILCFR